MFDGRKLVAPSSLIFLIWLTMDLVRGPAWLLIVDIGCDFTELREDSIVCEISIVDDSRPRSPVDTSVDGHGRPWR